VPTGFLPPTFTAHDSKRPPFKRDVAAARRLLAEAGFPGGFEIDATVLQEEEQGRKLGLVLQSALKDAGIKVNIVYAPPLILYSRVAKLETAPVFGGHLMMAPLSGDAGTYLRQVFGGENAGKPWNHAWYQNPEVDKLLDEAERSPDEQKRIELWRRAETIIIDDQPVIFTTFATPINEPVRDRVMNYLYHPLEYSGVFQFYHVYLR